MHATVPHATAIARTLADLAESEPALVVMVEGDGTPADGLDADRVLRMPVADRAQAAVATGLAWAGRRVVLEVSSTGRLPALAEALTEVARPREGFDRCLVVRVPMGQEAPGVDATALVLLDGIPGLRVVVARDTTAATGLLRAAVASRTPTVILEPRTLLGAAGPAADGPRSLDALDVVRPGADVTIATFGAGVDAALEVAESLSGEGIEAEVVDLVSLSPLDLDGLGARVRSTGRLVAAAPEGELGAAQQVLRAALGPAFLYLEAPPVACAASVAGLVRAARDAALYE